MIRLTSTGKSQRTEMIEGETMKFRSLMLTVLCFAVFAGMVTPANAMAGHHHKKHHHHK